MGLEQGLNGIYAITIQKNQSMAKLTGYGVGGRAKYFVTVYSAKALLEVIEQCNQNNCKYKLIGNGTNLLFSDKGYDGVVISLKGLNSITQENGIVSATAGVRLCDLVLFSAEFGLYGGETLVGIPATVGGATVMNAGAYGSCISDYIKTVTTINNGKLCKYDKNQCDFCYRHSRFLGKKEPIISVDFCFNQNKEKGAIPQELINRCKELRKSVQPSGRSCGSVFKNPQGDFAGRLIERAGLKGFTIGKASVSNKHANFIITKSGATASDVYRIITTIQQEVKNQFGIELQREIELVGEF